ncbi:hypothetical protein V6Z90_007603 [Aspergillus fumigatus]
MLPCQWIHQVCNLPRAPEHAKLHDRIDTHIRRPRRIKHPRRPIQRIPSPRTCLLPHPPQPIHHRMVQEERWILHRRKHIAHRGAQRNMDRGMRAQPAPRCSGPAPRETPGSSAPPGSAARRRRRRTGAADER